MRVCVSKNGEILFDQHDTGESLCPAVEDMTECISALQRSIDFLELSLSARNCENADVVLDRCGTSAKVENDVPVS